MGIENHMELRHLRYFVAVAEELHFGRAAKRLHITQPPLSQQIQLLERELGVKLLIRGRKVQLTEAGRVFLEEARRTIDVAERAARAARAAGAGAAARLRVGYPAVTLVELVPASFRRFAERFPNIGIEAVAGHTGGLLSALHDDQLDLAFLTMSGHESEAVCFKLLHREPLVVAIPDNHPLASQAAVAMSDLAEQPMILLPRALEPLHEHLPSVVLADTPAASLMVHEAITLESAYSAVAAGLAVAIIVESTAQTVAVHGVVHRPFAPPQPALELSLAWPHGQMSTAARSFLMIVTDTAAALEMMRNGPRSMASSAHLTSSAAARSIDSPDAIGTLIP
jgi:DNA-binding transcriptional LysR family regulator